MDSTDAGNRQATRTRTRNHSAMSTSSLSRSSTRTKTVINVCYLFVLVHLVVPFAYKGIKKLLLCCQVVLGRYRKSIRGANPGDREIIKQETDFIET